MNRHREDRLCHAPRPHRHGFARVLLSCSISLGLVYGLLRLAEVSPVVIWDTLKNVSVTAVAVGLVLHIVTYVLRALRFRILITSRTISLSTLFDISAIHNFMNHVLPLRTGELTYVYLVHQSQRVALGEALGTLAIVRIMDLMAFCIYYPVAIVLLHVHGFDFPKYVWKVLWLVGPFFLALTVLLVLGTWKGKSMVEISRRWLLKGFLKRLGFIHLVFDKMEDVAYSFESLGKGKVYLHTLFISLGILGLVYAIAFVVLAGMGYRMSYPLVIFCSTLAYLGFLLPVYSFGGLGTVEAGWTIGCMAAGFSKEMGVASGLTFHIIILGYVSLMALYGLARLERLRS